MWADVDNSSAIQANEPNSKNIHSIFRFFRRVLHLIFIGFTRAGFG
jgi:hypothetical protein